VPDPVQPPAEVIAFPHRRAAPALSAFRPRPLPAAVAAAPAPVQPRGDYDGW
jgi:hypothetical protein